MTRVSSSESPLSVPRRTRNWVVTTNSLRPPPGWSKSKKRTLRESCPWVVLTVRGSPKVRYSWIFWLRAIPTSLTLDQVEDDPLRLRLGHPVVETQQGGPQPPLQQHLALLAPLRRQRLPRHVRSTPAAPAARGPAPRPGWYSLSLQSGEVMAIDAVSGQSQSIGIVPE